MLEKSNAIHMYLAVSAPLYFMAKTVRDTVGETAISLANWICPAHGFLLYQRFKENKMQSFCKILITKTIVSG